jgi:hypothetical protein
LKEFFRAQILRSADKKRRFGSAWGRKDEYECRYWELRAGHLVSAREACFGAYSEISVACAGDFRNTGDLKIPGFAATREQTHLYNQAALNHVRLLHHHREKRESSDGLAFISRRVNS